MPLDAELLGELQRPLMWLHNTYPVQFTDHFLHLLKTEGFLMFSGSAERDQCHGICSCIAEWPSYLFFGQIVIQQRDEKTF